MGWFETTFLPSFELGEHYAQYTWLKSWQYKGLMNLAKSNNWHMLSSRQLNVILNNSKEWMRTCYKNSYLYMSSKYIVVTEISNSTGFVTIDIRDAAKLKAFEVGKVYYDTVYYDDEYDPELDGDEGFSCKVISRDDDYITVEDTKAHKTHVCNIDLASIIHYNAETIYPLHTCGGDWLEPIIMAK